MDSVLQPTVALVDPAGAVPKAVSARRWVWPLIAVALATSFAGAAFAVRYDAAPGVIRELTENDQLKNTTEKELTDQITTAGRVKLVGGVAKGVFAVPFFVLLFAVGVKIACWFIGRPIKFGDSFTAVAVAHLPIALCRVLYGVVALSSESLGDSQAGTLLPTHLGNLLHTLTPELARAAATLDIFNLWAAVLLGFGIAAGTGMKTWKGVAFALFLYALFAGVFLVGVPGIAAGGGGGPKS